MIFKSQICFSSRQHIICQTSINQFIIKNMFQQAIKQKIQALKEHLSHHPQIQIIGICGIPGSGKSTISQIIYNHIPNTVVLSMDGYHIQRKYLNQQGIKRRGAPFTFDMKGFKNKMQQIRSQRKAKQIGFPKFDHKQKDPVFDAIKIPINAKYIFVEGIYTFDQNQDLDKFWDLKIWIQTDQKTAVQRMAKRHVQAGITPNIGEAYNRIETSDRLNIKYIFQNCYSTSDSYFIIQNP